MEIVGLILMIIGTLIALVYSIQLLIMAFRESILWGLGYILVPFVSLIFLIMFWSETKSPFLKSLLCIPCFIAAALLTPTVSSY